MSKIIPVEKLSCGFFHQHPACLIDDDRKEITYIQSDEPVVFEKDGKYYKLNGTASHYMIPMEVLFKKESSFQCIIGGLGCEVLLTESDWIDEETYNSLKELDDFEEVALEIPPTRVQAIEKGGEVKIMEPLTTFKEINLSKPTDLTLYDDITAKGSGLNITADVTIDGPGALKCGEGGDFTAVTVRAGTTTVKSGKFSVGGDADGKGNSCIYANGGNVVIEGGRFETAKPWPKNGKLLYYVLNVKNGSGSKILCKGGTFVGQNPADGDDNDGGNFVAEGYKSVKTGENEWTVVPV